MESKVCLDTDACIEILKGTEKGRKITEVLAHCRMFISTVTMFELLLRKTHLDAVETFLSKVEIVPFSPPAARKASEMYKKLSAEGRPLEIRDLFIASCAVAENMVLLTFNKKHFKNIPSLNLLEV